MKGKTTLFALMALFIFTSYGFCKDRLMLTDHAYGIVVFGDKLVDVERKLGEKVKGYPDNEDCDYVTFKKYPGIKFMVERRIVTRADITDSSIPNALGIKIGKTLQEVKRRYPKVLIEPHKYVDTGHYLIFKSSDGKRAIVFEEIDGKITRVRAGLEPSVEYVEGCL